MSLAPLHRLAALLLAGCACAAQAHDFWIQPASFFAATDGDTPFTLQVGHGLTRQRSALPLRRIERFGHVNPLGRIDDARGALARSAERDGHLSLPVPGVHVLFLQSDGQAQSHLPAARFNAYLHEEGLTAALAHRTRHGLLDRPGVERYRRVAKTLVQVGPPGAGGQEAATRPLGLPLEIVPDRSPYLQPATARLPIRVLYQGRPLAGARVKLSSLDDDGAPIDARVTDAAGNALFALPPPGSWRLAVVWTQPADGGDGIDFDTVFSSLTFAVAPPEAP